jgi:hypothetical protein
MNETRGTKTLKLNRRGIQMELGAKESHYEPRMEEGQYDT